MSSIIEFLRLPWVKKRLVVQMTWWLGATRLGLSLLPFQTVQRIFSGLSQTGRPPRQDEGSYQQQLLWAVRVVGRRVLGDKPCLPQALVVQCLLARVGQGSTLHIGVAKAGKRLLAHAWLESEGRILIGGRSSLWGYTPLQPVGERGPSQAPAQAVPEIANEPMLTNL